MSHKREPRDPPHQGAADRPLPSTMEILERAEAIAYAYGDTETVRRLADLADEVREVEGNEGQMT